jgi:hypothetical protein
MTKATSPQLNRPLRSKTQMRKELERERRELQTARQILEPRILPERRGRYSHICARIAEIDAALEALKS